MSPKTCVVNITIPATRKGCDTWLQTQSPEIVANLLECSEHLNTILTKTKDHVFDQHTLKSTIKKLETDHQQELQLATQKLELHKKRLQTENQDLEATLGMERKTIKTQYEQEKLRVIGLHEEQILHCRKEHEKLVKHHIEDLEQNQRLSEQKHTTQIANVNQQISTLTTELNKFKGDEARLKQHISEEAERKILQERAECIDKLQQRQALCDIQVTNGKEQLSYAQNEMGRMQTQISQLQEKHDKLGSAMQQKADEYADRIANMVQSLRGSSSAKGDVGENFVKTMHSETRLGTYESDGHKRTPGFADGTIHHVMQHCKDQKGIIEAKNSDNLKIKVDMDKFKKTDIPAAVHQGRVNCGIFFSLTCRIHGKDMFYIEIIETIPVLWASRSADDDISAAEMVKIGFRMMAEIWPLLAHENANSEESTWTRVAEHLQTQTTKLDESNKVIATIESGANKMLRDVARLKEKHKEMLTQIQNVQFHDTKLTLKHTLHGLTEQTPFWDTAEASTLLAEIKQYYETHPGRYPKTIEDLQLDDKVALVIQGTPNAFLQAREKVKESTKNTKKAKNVAGLKGTHLDQPRN